MARITTLAAMKAYVKRMLGKGVITVEVSDEQIEQIIEDTIQIFQEYYSGEGNYLNYIPFTVSAGVTTYNVSAYNLAATIAFDLTNTNDGINVLFSDTHNILWKDWVIYGNYPGGPGGGEGGSGMILSNYDIATQYLEDVRDRFEILYNAQYSDARQEILLTPTPTENGIGLLTVYTKETAENLYNNHLVKQLAVAKTKYLWGSMLGKYTMTLPSGGTINGGEIKADGEKEIEAVMERIRTETEGPLMYIE
jgi:hypothetical protein